MSGSPVNEIIKGYIEEVQTYIPSLTNGINSLKDMPHQKDVLEEIHRLVHTIKGASLMVGIPGLSNIALQMENALSDMIAGKLEFTSKTCEVMEDTINQFKEYCSSLVNEGVNSWAMLRQTIIAYRRLRGLPEQEDEQAIAPILEEIPEYEGGMVSGEADANFIDMAEVADIIEPEPDEIEPEMYEPSPMPDIIPELLESFYEESKEHLEDLDVSLNLLEAQITSSTEMNQSHKEIIRKIRRSVHTLKGASAVIGLLNVSNWGHIMEDFLDWLYEDASIIEPETVSLLMESGDLLAKIVDSPQNPQKDQCKILQNKYNAIIGPSDQTKHSKKEKETSISDEAEEADDKKVHENSIIDKQSLQPQTLRVGTEKMDELVNLIGELIISASAFDQQMNILIESVNELEVSRQRLREIARNMEVGYEVKALGSLKGITSDNKDFEDFDSLELDRYSELNMIIRTLNESVIDVGSVYTRLSHLHSDFDGYFNRQRVLLSELQDKMMQVRMLPMSTLSNKLRRTIREVAKVLGKKIRLTIDGEDIELDRLIWEKITDPLMHLLRNAADHGIEMPEVRKKKNKPPVATIKLKAAREGNQVVIRISDDGAGLDYQNIQKKAQQAGFITPSDELSKEQLAALIFKPGLSTSDKISQVSGRGVGMDVVRENIHELKGSVRVASQPDKGTQFTIRIPLTLAAVRALLFTVADQTFAIALNEISEIIRAEPQDLIFSPARAVKKGDDILPIYSLKNFLHSGSQPDKIIDKEDCPIVLVVGLDGDKKALEIDSLLGQQEIVIKSTGSHLRYVKGISGVTIIGDGSVVPILNIPELIGQESIHHTDISKSKTDNFDYEMIADKPLNIMVVDDSISIRQVVSRLLEEQGWKVQTAKDGIEALEKLQDITIIPDLILLDIEMPRMNGYELLSALGAEPKYKDIPVIMLTSRATGKHRNKATSLGARGFVIKPYNDNEFIDLILKTTS